jgi:hypothetical protein
MVTLSLVALALQASLKRAARQAGPFVVFIAVNSMTMIKLARNKRLAQNLAERYAISVIHLFLASYLRQF